MERLHFDKIPPDPGNEEQMLAWRALVALVAHANRLADAVTPVREYVEAGYPLDTLLTTAGYEELSDLRFARIALGFNA